MSLTQEVQTITKETQRIVLKAIYEFPTLAIEELGSLLKSRGENTSPEEVLQVLQSISPNKNWHRASLDDVHKEILSYVWTIEQQILFVFPTKQKETTVAEFNQFRLQNKQPKVSKDLIRHLQGLLLVDGKNLSKFRRFQKDLSLQNDIDANTQALWLIRILLGELSLSSISSTQDLLNTILNEIKEKHSLTCEKVGKTCQRISEKFIERYFPKNISESTLKELLAIYQIIYHNCKKGTEIEMSIQSELQEGYKLIFNIIEELKGAQEIIKESHEGGFLSKLLTGKIKNKEGVIKKIDNAIELVNQLNEVTNKTNKASNEKTLIVQKLQSDYENIVLIKSQLEHDLYSLKEKYKELEEKNTNRDQELQDKTEALEKAHEKIASLQQKVDGIPELESKTNTLREDLGTAKDISIRLYRRVSKLKEDLLKQDKPRTNNHEHKTNTINNHTTIHKIQQNQEATQIIEVN